MKLPSYYRFTALLTFLLIPLNGLIFSDVIINIDLTEEETGPAETIVNTGSLAGDFEAEFDIPNIETVDGVNAVTLDGNNDWYLGPESSPLTGSASRSIEAWVWNPSVPSEETIFAWGRRGGPDATNFSMLYGVNSSYGALGAWGGAPDMPFYPGGGAPAPNEWHHLVLTYDGQSNQRSIFVDGQLTNSEDDGPIFNTHETDDSGLILPMVIGNQNESNGTRSDNLSADLSIAKIKVHDLVLTENDVLQSFDEDKNQFGKGGPEIISFESSETQISPDDTITLSWEIDGAEKISIDNGVGDVSNEEEVDVSIEETTTFTITATDDAGLSQTDSILIIVSDGSALIDIDLTGLDPGPLQTIINQGSLAGDFEAEFDTPNIETIDGVNAVTLDGNNDWYIGPDSTPLTGNASRSIEAWVWNEFVPAEETIIAWGRRGGPDATNWSMLYGNHNTWGALGGWGGAADMPFQPGGGNPSTNEWHHLVLTYDGISNERSIYVDGELSNSENDGPIFNTHETDTSGNPLPIVIGNQNENNGTRVDNLSAELSIAKIKVHDTTLSLEDVQQSFDGDRAIFGKGGPRINSFIASPNPINEGDTISLTWDIVGAESIEIDEDIGDVTDLSEIEVTPEETTIYTISATDSEGIIQQKELTVFMIGEANLIHQWTFDEIGGAGTTLSDSISGADGEIVDLGNNDGEVKDGSVTLSGGGKNDSDYIRLPANLLSPLTNATLETWSTQHSAQNWSRVFSIGSSTNNVMHMSFSRGTNINQNELRWNAQANMTLQDFGGAPPNPIDEQVHWVVTINDVGGPNGETQVTVFRNGIESRVGNTNNDLSGLDDNDIFLGRSQWGDNTANASWDEFRIYDGILTTDQIQKNTLDGPSASIDTDEDGISDSIEDKYDFLDPEDPSDAELDQDNDGLSNVAEIQLGSDPEEQDTDNDEILDGDEVINQTSPILADTDGDSLNDGQEISIGTNPLISDTDGDGITDGVEFENGSNPLDPNSLPAAKLPELIHRWSFDEIGGDGTILIDSIGGSNGVLEDGGQNQGDVNDGKITLPGGVRADTDFVRLPASLISSLESTTIETWTTQYSVQNWSRVFSVGSGTNNVMHMSFSRGTDINLNELRWNAQSNITLQDFGGRPTNTLDEQIHWVVTVDGGPEQAGQSKISVYKNGDLVKEGSTPNKLSELNDTDFFLGRSQWNDNTANASWEDFRIYDGAMDSIGVKVSNKNGPDIAPGQVAFEITNIEYNSDNKTASITWNSKPGGLYVIWTSQDGQEWSDVDDAYQSQGDQTTFNEIDASEGVLLIRVGISE
ncbi:MAG: LamG-like jellyroll fold domain-containing protein [Verrucomicrobiales bacterium]